MENNKLIPANEFLMQFKGCADYANAFHICVRYAHFLSQPLSKGFFIPCDENDNVLEEPKEYSEWYKWGSFTKAGEAIVDKCKKYHAGKSKILFKGFEIEDNIIWHAEGNDNGIYRKSLGKWEIWGNYHTVEDLIGDFFPGLTLTEQALKKIWQIN